MGATPNSIEVRHKNTGTAFCLLLILLVAYGGSAAAAKRERSVPIKVPMQVMRKGKNMIVALAPAVQQAVRRHYPRFRIIRLDDYASFIVRDVQEGYDNQSPALFACVGDFDGNGLPDIALLLIDRRNHLLLVALHQTRNGRFRPHLVDRWTLHQLRDNEWLTGEGKLVCSIRRAKGRDVGVRHRSDGIEVDDPGEWSEFFFFYRNGRYRYKFLTANA